MRRRAAIETLDIAHSGAAADATLYRAKRAGRNRAFVGKLDAPAPAPGAAQA